MVDTTDPTPEMKAYAVWSVLVTAIVRAEEHTWNNNVAHGLINELYGERDEDLLITAFINKGITHPTADHKPIIELANWEFYISSKEVQQLVIAWLKKDDRDRRGIIDEFLRLWEEKA